MPLSLNLPQVLGGATLLCAFYYVYWQLTVGASRRAMIRANGCEPVPIYPSRYPLGIDLFTEMQKAHKEKRALEAFSNRLIQMGVNTMTAPALGRWPVITIEPENLKTIQSLKFKDYCLGGRRKPNFHPLIGDGIFTSDGAAWQHSREMLRPSFVRSQVGDVDTFETHVSHLIDAIPRNGGMVDLQDLFFRLTIDSATEFLFGESTNCLAPGLSTVSASAFATNFNKGQEYVAARGRYGPFGRIVRLVKPRGEFEKSAAFVHNFVDGYVERALARRQEILDEKTGSGQRYIFLHELVRQTTDPIQIRGELLHILLAGRDTTASLLSNVWWFLSKRPDIWAKLRAEVAALNGKQPSFEDLKGMKYLQAIMNESLRLHPVVPMNSRQAVRDTVLPVGGGKDGKAPVFVKEGRMVTWNVYLMHRRKDFYGEDAEEFRPERWVGEKGLRPGWEYLPFNGGPRICLGQQFALTEAGYTTVRLMQEFEGIESRDPLDYWQENLTITCVGTNCKVALKPW